MISQTDSIPVFEAAVAAAKRAEGLSSDAALARTFGISAKTISLLRRGRWTPTQAAIIRILIDAKLLCIPTGTLTSDLHLLLDNLTDT